ncbi:MAG: hypothetical protein H0W31_00275 [Actinobacteria bacterium]|nr:hypothetical protein [Actinomycetota bacterium]
MADSKISALTAAATLAATDQLVIASSGATKKLSSSILPGFELAYAEFTAEVSVTTATTIVTAPAFTADGVTPIRVEFMACTFAGNNAGDTMSVHLYEDGASIGNLAEVYIVASSFGISGFIHAVSDDMIPASGSRTYSIRATRSAANAMSVYAGAGGAGNRRPGFIRVVRV